MVEPSPTPAQFSFSPSSSECLGILLTGGNSTRFGANKLAQTWGSTCVGLYSAETLLSACSTTYEAGSGMCSLPQIPDTLGIGPLGAVAVATSYLRRQGTLSPTGCLLVLAADMPLIGPTSLRIVANWPGGSSVVPVVNGHPQWLAARWSASALDRAIAQVESGDFRVKSALDNPETHMVTHDMWETNVHEYIDVDTPTDYEIALRHHQRMQTAGS